MPLDVVSLLPARTLVLNPLSRLRLPRVLGWMPCRRQISAVFPVASCSLRMATICGSVYRDFLTIGLLDEAICLRDHNFIRTEIRGLNQN